MPLLLQENYTVKLGSLLRNGDIDVAILSLPYEDTGIATQPVYDEPFRVVMPAAHAWAEKTSINAAQLCNEKLLLLGAGNCFRDQVLQTCAGTKGNGVQQYATGARGQLARNNTPDGRVRCRHYGAAVVSCRKQVGRQ